MLSINKRQQYLYAFLIGFSIALIAVFYKYFTYGILDLSFESFRFLKPALILNETNSLIHFRALDRLPVYPFTIYFILKIFGPTNYLAIVFFQSILNGLIVAVSIATKNLITKKYYWISIFLLVFNINFFWSATIILPDLINVFFIVCAIYFFLKFILEKQSLNFIVIGSIFFALSFLTKPSGILIPIALTIFMLIYYFFEKKYKLSKVIIFSLIPAVIIFLISSPLYFYNYKKSGEAKLTFEKGSHLLFWVYPCLVKNWGCGSRDKDALENARHLSDIKINKKSEMIADEYPYVFEFKNGKLFYIKSLPFDDNYFKNKVITSKINQEIFFDLVEEVDKTQILKSYIGSTTKMLFHTSIIGIFGYHNISYTELKSVISSTNISLPGIIWLLSQILVVGLRALQFYGFTSVFQKKKKNFWPIIFLIFILVPFIISAVGIGNPRYRIPIEPILFLLTILGIKKLQKKIKN